MRCVPLEQALGGDGTVTAKLELMQRTGTFKARGALANLMTLDERQRAAGVTAASAGNHAIATAYAAQVLGVSARVVMIKSANPARIVACRRLGADIELADTAHEAFARAREIEQHEGGYLVHPFEGRGVALGTGTLGVELCEQLDAFDVLVVPVGGGGLISGVANAVKQLRPAVEIVGVEPEGADTMQRSFTAGKPQAIDAVATIADSLGAPYALPYSFEMARRNVDRLVRVSDDQLRAAMRFLFESMRLAVEPACAASTAAVLGPLREDLAGRHVAVIFCGSNIDWASFARLAGLDDAA